jgi:hypothetical protein
MRHTHALCFLCLPLLPLSVAPTVSALPAAAFAPHQPSLSTLRMFSLDLSLNNHKNSTAPFLGRAGSCISPPVRM